MGLVYDRQIFHTALDLHQAIADLGLVIKPNLTIIDGTAPAHQTARQTGDTATPGAWWPAVASPRSMPTGDPGQVQQQEHDAG